MGRPGRDTAPSGAASETGWQPPASYEFVLESSCGERALIGEFHITVEDGEVVDAEGFDESAQRLVAASGTEAIPTLNELLERASTAREEGADVVEVSTDASDGPPSSIDIDWNTDAIDDEECYVVADYTPRSDAPTEQQGAPFAG